MIYNSKEAYKDLGITQLGARIWELKNDGIEIRTRWKSFANRYGNKILYKEYFIREEEEK